MANTYQEATETKRDEIRHTVFLLTLFSASEGGRKVGTAKGRKGRGDGVSEGQ